MANRALQALDGTTKIESTYCHVKLAMVRVLLTFLMTCAYSRCASKCTSR